MDRVVAPGFGHALGLIHAGKPLSFVYDVADKVDFLAPRAFELVAESDKNVEQRARLACRNMFRKRRLQGNADQVEGRRVFVAD